MPTRQLNSDRKKRPGKKVKHPPLQVTPQLAEQMDRQEIFNFTYNASRHEREWIINSLGGFYEGHWLDDVLRLLKGGKEAHVYQCLANPSVAGLDQPYIAAKVYRPRSFRNLKNDHVYRQGRAALDGDGRQIIDDGMLHAMAKRTSYGLELMHTSWIEHEVRAIKILHSAGADVPAVHASGNNAILMTYIGGEDMPAPTLNSVDLDQEEAMQLFKRVLQNIEIMLANNIVHGDLSAYNILYWEGEITLIDFPQAIDPDINNQSLRIFERDMARVCEYFSRQGVKADSHQLAAELWTAYGRRLKPKIHPALLDANDDGDRAYWERMKE